MNYRPHNIIITDLNSVIDNSITDGFIVPSSILIQAIFIDYIKDKTFLSIEEFDQLKCRVEDFECCICLEGKKRGILLDCNHKFCKKCIRKWLTEKSSQCPVCRQNVRK
jgi:hypothetical protein